MKTFFLWMAAAHVAAAATAATAQTASSDAFPQQDATPAQIAEGSAAFAENCSHCHGPNMVTAGTVAPDLRGFPDDKARFFRTVKTGKNNRMPPWGDILSDDQITKLWAYVSSRRKP